MSKQIDRSRTHHIPTNGVSPDGYAEVVRLKHVRNKKTGLTYRRRQAVAAAAVAAVSLGGAYLAGQSNEAQKTIESPQDNGKFEQEAIVSQSILTKGVLTLREGANLRHTPEIKNLDPSTGDGGDNQAYTLREGEVLTAENVISSKNPVSGEVWLGFTLQLPSDSSGEGIGVYWFSQDAALDLNDKGVQVGIYTPGPAGEPFSDDQGIVPGLFATVLPTGESVTKIIDPTTQQPTAIGTLHMTS